MGEVMDDTALLNMSQEEYEARRAVLMRQQMVRFTPGAVAMFAVRFVDGAWFFVLMGVVILSSLVTMRTGVAVRDLQRGWEVLHPVEVVEPVGPKPPAMRRGFILSLLGFFGFIGLLLLADVLTG